MARHAGLFLWIAVWLAVARFCGLLLPLQSEVVVPSHASPLHDHVDRHVRADEPDDLMRTASLPGAVDSAVRMLQPSSLPRGRQTNFGGTSRLDGTIREDGRIQHWKQTGQHRERPGAAAGRCPLCCSIAGLTWRPGNTIRSAQGAVAGPFFLN